MEYREMMVEDIPIVTALYVASFNAAPWYDKWTEESAAKRLTQMLRRDSAYGLLAYDAQGVCGLIIGDEEQFYYGPQFQIREFCVDNSRRGQGFGTAIYQELEQRLRQRGICEIVLYTLHHKAAEGFYQRQGMTTSQDIVYMTKKLT